MVAGFGLGEARLPVPPGITLPEYDDCCVAAGLTLVDRFATWDAAPCAGGGCAVGVLSLCAWSVRPDTLGRMGAGNASR